MVVLAGVTLGSTDNIGCKTKFSERRAVAEKINHKLSKLIFLSSENCIVGVPFCAKWQRASSIWRLVESEVVLELTISHANAPSSMRSECPVL